MATKKKTIATPKGEHDPGGGIGGGKKRKKKKTTPKKIAKKDMPLKVNTSFENLLNMAIDSPPKKKRSDR